MATASASYHGYEASMTASMSVTRNGNNVTVRIPWSVSGTGYAVYCYVNGSQVYSKVGGTEYHDGSGTATIGPFTKYDGGTLSYSISIRVYRRNDSSYGSGSNSVSASVSAATYTITFNPGEGTTPTTSKTVTYGQTYGELPTPTRSGCLFLGWFTSAEGGTERKSTDTVSITSNTTLYAHWKLQTIFHLIQNKSEILAPLCYIKEGNDVTQAVGLYVKEGNNVYQCI